MKYAYGACESLSSEVWSISEAVLENQESLRQFWNYIKQPAPLDPVQAGYFTKVNESLLDRKMEEMIDFFKSIDNVVPDMLQHVDCPMIMDLLLKIISLEKSEGGQGIVDVCVDTLVTWRYIDKYGTVASITGLNTPTPFQPLP
jgi:SIT4-associating protein SAP185/190